MSTNGHPEVVITGIGVVSPFGVGRNRFWQHVSAGCSGTKAITQFDVSDCASQVAAWVPPLSMDDALPLEGDDDRNGRADPKRYTQKYRTPPLQASAGAGWSGAAKRLQSGWSSRPAKHLRAKPPQARNPDW